MTREDVRHAPVSKPRKRDHGSGATHTFSDSAPATVATVAGAVPDRRDVRSDMPDRICSVARCTGTRATNRARAGTGYWCISCLTYWNRTGKDPAGRQGLMVVPDGCVIVENGVRCGRRLAVKSRGWCGMHRARARRNGGDPMACLYVWGDVRKSLERAAQATGPECFIPAGWEGERRRVRFDGQDMPATRAVWIIATGKAPAGLMLHTCNGGSGAHGCIAIGHLYEGDDAQNVRDMVDAERQARGERQGSSVLTEAQVLEIRRRHVPGRHGHKGSGNKRALAEEFGVSPMTIRDIVSGRIWGWLQERPGDGDSG